MIVMKRQSLIIAVVMAAGCSDGPDPIGITAIVQRTVDGSEAAAADERSGATSTFLEIGTLRSADCTDEIVEITGTIHLLFHEQADGSWMGHSNYQGVSAVGLTTGTNYRVAGAEHFRLQAPFPSSIQQQGSFLLIEKGGDSNLVVHTLFHVTVTPDGEIAAAFDWLSVECR